eukprot:TRINITY_DN2568_c0_g1_i1.p1 TRINITY_DN2568_c0_g1~~TRINITY_DN2568_c0_g1_i1.p1  ORF type:complete len:187 (+),score=35.73 TRINITY_DN2568_c0_g1_i1:80-562(+)
MAKTTSVEAESQVSAQRLWNAMVKDSHNLLPSVAPQIFTSAAIVEGDGGVGSVKEFRFAEGQTQGYSFVKEKVEVFDEKNFVYKYSVVDGGLLGKKWSSASFEMKFTPKGDGCTVTWTLFYEPIPGVDMDEEKVKESKEKILGLFSKIHEYLLSNPALYN